MNACGRGDRVSIDEGDGFLSPYSARGGKRALAVLLSLSTLVVPLLLPRQGESPQPEVLIARPAAAVLPLSARLVNDETYTPPTPAPPPRAVAVAKPPVHKTAAKKTATTAARKAAPARKPQPSSSDAMAASNPIVGNTQSGQASWYDAPQGTCAHRSLPKGTVVTVTAVESGKQVSCRVADRGPYIRGRIIDLARDVFEVLTPSSHGVISVRIEW